MVLKETNSFRKNENDTLHSKNKEKASSAPMVSNETNSFCKNETDTLHVKSREKAYTPPMVVIYTNKFKNESDSLDVESREKVSTPPTVSKETKDTPNSDHKDKNDGLHFKSEDKVSVPPTVLKETDRHDNIFDKDEIISLPVIDQNPRISALESSDDCLIDEITTRENSDKFLDECSMTNDADSGIMITEVFSMKGKGNSVQIKGNSITDSARNPSIRQSLVTESNNQSSKNSESSVSDISIVGSKYQRNSSKICSTSENMHKSDVQIGCRQSDRDIANCNSVVDKDCVVISSVESLSENSVIKNKNSSEINEPKTLEKQSEKRCLNSSRDKIIEILRHLKPLNDEKDRESLSNAHKKEDIVNIEDNFGLLIHIREVLDNTIKAQEKYKIQLKEDLKAG